MIKIHNREIELWKKKYDDLERKLQNLALSETSINEYKERVEDLESKIKILIEENDKLNQVINENIKTANCMTELEERVSNLMSDNLRLEEDLNKWKDKFHKIKS